MKTRIASISKKIGLINQATLDSLQATDERQIIKKFTDAGLKILGGDFGFAWFRLRGNSKFEQAYKTATMPYDPPLPRDKGINYRVIRRKIPFFAPNLQSREKSIKVFLKSYVIIPVSYKNHTYGNVVLCFKKSHPFSIEDRSLCEALGNAAAQAITINRLYSNLKDFKDRLDRTLDSIIIFDVVAFKIEYVNLGAVKVLGFSRGGLLQKRLPDMISVLHRAHFQMRIQRLLQGKTKATIFESEVISKNGASVPVEFFLQLVDIPGHIPKFLVIAHNITKRLITRQQIQKLLKQKDEFLGIASHELRTPLTTIKGFTQLLQKRVQGQDPEVDRFLTKINAQTDNLTRLVNELLDISKIEVGKLTFEQKPLNLNNLVKEIVEDLQFTTDHHQIILNGKLRGWVVGDASRLAQVFRNIITNAIKYSPSGKEILVKLRQKGGEAFVSVQDFGIGIPRKFQNQVFEKFFQGTRGDSVLHSGLGLGLHISREIIRGHGGEIWFESRPRSGTTFFIKLPRKNDKYQ